MTAVAVTSCQSRALRWWRIAAATVWIALLAVLVLRPLLSSDPARNNVYLKVFAKAADHFKHRQPLYERDNEPGSPPTEIGNPVDGASGFRFPPLAAALLVPFELCGDRLGSVVWRLTNLGLLLAGVLALFRAGFPFPPDPLAKAFTLFVVAANAVISLNNGQANAVVLGGLLLATAATLTGRHGRAALCVGTSAAWKVYPASFGFVLAALQPSRLLWLVPTLAAILLLPLVFAPSDYVLAQYRALWSLLANEDRTQELGRSYRDLRLLTAVCGVPLSKPTFLSLQVAGGAAIVLLCRQMQRRAAPERQVLDYALSLTLCWCLLLGPATEKATYTLFGPVLAYGLLQSWRMRDRILGWWVLAAILVVLDAVPIPRAQQIEHPWLRILLPLAALIATMALALRARTDLRLLAAQRQQALA